MNLPNKITLSRIFLTVFIIIFLLFPFYSVGITFPKYDVSGIVIDLKYIIAGVLFVIAALTDFIDGNLARKRNLVTDTGKMLDAIADKVLVNPVLIVLAANSFIPTIVPVIYVTRDIVVDAIKMQAASKGKVQAAIKSGKYKTACMMVGICLVFFYNIPFEFFNVNVAYGLLYLGKLTPINEKKESHSNNNIKTVSINLTTVILVGVFINYFLSYIHF